MSSGKKTGEGRARDLIFEFRREAEATRSMAPQQRKTTKYKMPLALYNMLREIHRRSLEMAMQILEVIDDAEHEFMMEFARHAEHAIPDMVLIRGEIELYADFLKGFSPENVSPSETGNAILMPAETVLKLAQMLQYNNSVLKSLRDTLRDTAYMDVFTAAKTTGLIYTGKSALAEVLNWAIASQIIKSDHKQATDPGKWPVVRYKDTWSGPSSLPH